MNNKYQIVSFLPALSLYPDIPSNPVVVSNARDVLMSLFEENERILQELEETEARVERIKIDGVDTADEKEKMQIAAQLKSQVAKLVSNIAASKGNVQLLGGALVLVDLLDVLKKYKDIFDIPELPRELENLEKMWEQSH